MPIRNPVLAGFNPDPCVIRVGPDYFLATSTFEWWPGVAIYHSLDLAQWNMIGHALNRTSQVNLRGVPDSAGIWAPGLSYYDGVFYLAFTHVMNARGANKDLANFVVTAPHPSGPWSEPSYLNGTGFDPSLFHDEDGRSWLLNMSWDPRPGRNRFAGILRQEFDRATCTLRGEARTIFAGSVLGRTEGPHVYRRGGFYYLITAEGGTGWTHAVTVARARSLDGPFELSPHNPLLTSAGDEKLPLQKSGHGSLVVTPEGHWVMAHLCARSLPGLRRCPLGRETAFQNLRWTNEGWPVLAHGSSAPAVEFTPPDCPGGEVAPASIVEKFIGPALRPVWQTLREPTRSDWLIFGRSSAGLWLRGRQSLDSGYDQSLVAHRLTTLDAIIEVTVDANPTDPRQLAGLALYYNTSLYYQLALTWDEQVGRCLRLIVRDAGKTEEALPYPEPVAANGSVRLRAVLSGGYVRFGWRSQEKWRDLGPALDISILSDDYHSQKNIGYGFTGTFVGLYNQDLVTASRWAGFSDYDFRPDAVASS